VARARAVIVIDRPIEDVFAVLTNVENTARWWPGNVEEHWTSSPPHAVGSTRHAKVRMLGRTVENDAVVTEYDPPRRAAIEGTTPTAPFRGVLEFDADGSGTRVLVTTEIRVTGVASPIGAVFARWYGRQWARGLDRLKGMMERGEL
jgi:uncharacterized protein YndB with AHSA1/START domain